jgi:UDP-N-acetylglucosamine 2-epimerase (non-hydrolysing)
VAEGKIRLVGNVMIDTLLSQLPRARERSAAARLRLPARGYGFVTLHRPSNVDDPAVLGSLIALLHELSRDLPLVFPVHPRTRNVVEKMGLRPGLEPGQERLFCLGPQPYLETISLVADASVVLTDSGGLQEECSVLGVPCLTLRENTERPVTVELGTSRLVGNDPDRIRTAFTDVREGRWPSARTIPFWDGRAGERVAEALAERFAS